MVDRLDRKTLEAAATWYVQLSATRPSEAERAAWQNWLGETSANSRAWARVEKLHQQLGGLPQEVALPTLSGARARRRAVVKTLAMLLAVGAAGWSTAKLAPTQVWLAEQRTGKGQRRHLLLEDGSQLDLNTDSAVDIAYDDNVRQLYLRRGEILITTATDPAARPFVVHTSEGSIRALGTRFVVRSEAGSTAVQVLEHAVELRPQQQPSTLLRLNAGEQVSFDQQHIGVPAPLPYGAGAWTQDMLTVIEWRLGDFIAELGRYRPGYLACDEAIADLRLSGAFRLDNTDTVLENLCVSLPVRIQYLTRYWVAVKPR